MIRILLCDGQTLLRSGLRKLVEEQSDFAVVGEAGDADEGLREMRRLSPDITLADLDTVRCGSVQPRAYFGCGRVIVLAHDDSGALMHAVRTGARGVILKSSSPDELVSGIRAVAAGESWMTPTLAYQVVAQLSGVDAGDGGGHQSLSGLTNRELDVLHLLGGGLSNAEIADVLVVGEATVKSHVSNVLRKLKVRNRVQAMLLARDTRLVGHGDYPAEPAWVSERSG